MNHNNENLNNMLAAEYVLGTLRGLARQRFERWLRGDAALRNVVTQWQTRLGAIANAAPEVAPPERVWRNIQARIVPEQRSATLWDNVGFWRLLAIAASVAALAIALILGNALRDAERAPTYVAVLADDKAQPVMLVKALAGKRELTIAVTAPQTIGSDKTFELWSLPKDGKPRSLGLVPASGRTVLTLKAAPETTFADVPALAISLEPSGGSPTGQPTGPVVFTGAVVQM